MSGIAIFGIFFAVFIVVMLGLGVVSRRWINRSSDYLVAGREVNLIVNILGVASIGYAGTTLTLSPSFAITGGFVKSMFVLGVCYSLIGIGSYGLFVAPIARRSGAHTLPEWMELKFDIRTREVIALTATVAMIGITANNVLSMAMILSAFTGWAQIMTIVICFVVFLIFTYLGGLWAVTLTDFVQGAICVIAIPLLLVTFLIRYGGWSFVQNHWPGGGNPLWVGITGTTFPWFSLKYPSVFVALFLYGLALVWGSNHYWIRVSSVRSERVARDSYTWAALILFIANGILYPLLGSYAGAAHPTTFSPIGKVNPASAFGIFLQDINPVVAAFLLLTTVAASISTATATHIAGSSMLIRDIYQRVFRPKAKPEELVVPSRVITLLFGLLCLLLCFFPGGPVYLFAFSTAWLAPSAVLLLLGMYWGGITPTGAFSGALTGIIFLSVWTLLDLTKIYPLTEKFGHMVIPGVVLTLLVTVIVSLATKKQLIVPIESKEVSLSELDQEVLDSINKGYNTMSELTDILDTDSSVTTGVIKKLESAQYITRQSRGGLGFYTFNITDKGKRKLPQVSKEEESLVEEGIDLLSLKILDYINSHPSIVTNDIVQITGQNPMKISTIIASLVRRNLLLEGGLWRRIVKISDKGKEVLNRYKELLGSY